MTEQGIAGLDVQAIENEITRLPEIVACRIVADPLGRPLEVHVLAHPGKHPKQVVRDIQSVALASFGVEIDRRIVSVVQLGPTGVDAAETATAPLARVSIGAIQSQLEGKRATIRVGLTSGSVEATGFAEGSIAAATRLRLVATATLDALRQLHRAAEDIEVEDASLRQGGQSRRCCRRAGPRRSAARIRAGRYCPGPSGTGRSNGSGGPGCRESQDLASLRRKYSRLIAQHGSTGRRTAVLLSYRLGGQDGVSVEARKWQWALGALGFGVRRVAGEFDDELSAGDVWLPSLRASARPACPLSRARSATRSGTRIWWSWRTCVPFR